MQSERGFKMAPLKLFIVFILAFTSAAFAQKIDLSSGAKVEFDAVGKPAMINIKGTGAKATGALSSKDKTLTGEFIVNLKDFTTDMDLRDEHMKEKYLEVEKPGYDKATLKVDQKIETAIPTSGNWEPQGLKGLLTLHGVTKEVPLNCKLNIKDSTATGVVIFKIKVNEYKIDIPSFAGVTMADEVDVKVLVNNKVVP
jgi:polyisoprenoid-binding protein YceI